jgi:hypothetical protein
VLRHSVLAALGAGVDAGDDDTARAAVARVEWVARAAVRRRLEAALVDAALGSGVIAPADGEDHRHLLRAAALIVRGERVALRDPARVRAAYDARPTPRPARWPMLTLLATTGAAAVVLALAALIFGVVTAPVPPGRPRPFVRPPPPPAVGAYRDGGAPARDLAIERVLVDELTALVVATNPDEVDHSVVRDAWLAHLRAATALEGHGPALAEAWHALLDAIEGWAQTSAFDPTMALRSADVRSRTAALSDQLAALGLGYFLDCEVSGTAGKRRLGVFTYAVVEVAWVGAAADRIRVLSLRRLDHLAAHLALLGMKPASLTDPVILLDEIDHHVRRELLPLFGDGASFPLADGAWARTRLARILAAQVGASIRDELIADVVAESALVDPVAVTTRWLTASVRRHEAQHGRDQARGLHLAGVAALFGAAHEDPFTHRTRGEISAYLSQLADDHQLATFTLWSLLRHAFRESRRGTPEAAAALVVLDGLARHLVPLTPALAPADRDPEHLAIRALPLAVTPPADLRRAAAELGEELFGRAWRVADR